MADRKLRRVMMTGDTVGGVWTYTLELAEALGAHGIEVLLATMGGDPTPEQHAEANEIPNLQLLPSTYKLEWMEDPWDDVEESGRWLLGLEAQFHPDVVHLNTFGHGDLLWQAPVVMTAHSCVLSWWAAVKKDPISSRWNRYRDHVRRSLLASDLLVAPSGALLRVMEENYGPWLPDGHVVPNGRNATKFRTAPKEPFVLTAGRLWDEAKNVAAIASIAHRLSWPSYVAGEDRHPNGEWMELAGCRSLGRLSASDLSDWYARAAIYALPARYEPFGLSVLEAALSGCALVLGDVDSLREVWADTALFVHPGDEDALQSALQRLIEDPSLREEMSGRSTARARTFTPEGMAQAYVQAYGSVADVRRMPCAS